MDFPNTAFEKIISDIRDELASVAPPVKKYNLSVTSGSDDGDYGKNAVVNILANAPGQGSHFSNWSSSNGGGALSQTVPMAMIPARQCGDSA